MAKVKSTNRITVHKRYEVTLGLLSKNTTATSAFYPRLSIWTKDDGPEESNKSNCRPRIHDLKKSDQRNQCGLICISKGNGSNFQISTGPLQRRTEGTFLPAPNKWKKRRPNLKLNRRKRHFCTSQKKNLIWGLLNVKQIVWGAEESLSSEVFMNKHNKHLSGRGWLSAILRRAEMGWTTSQGLLQLCLSNQRLIGKWPW